MALLFSPPRVEVWGTEEANPLMAKRKVFKIGDHRIRRGETQDIRLPVSTRYTGDPISLPLRVIRANKPGPTVVVTGTVHGDELNGLGVVHQIMYDDPPVLQRGTLVLIPVINVFGVETLARYMPDRRDLNRCFPGNAAGSLSSRFARLLFDNVVTRCEYMVDLHSAGAPRTNFPNVRADLRDKRVKQIAMAFGTELIVNGAGPAGSLRREAVRAGCAAMTLEAGEPGKIEPGVLELGVRGVKNVLKSLEMLPGDPTRPPYQARVAKSVWVRAEVAGVLRFHIAPGEPIEAGQPIATNASIFGNEQNVLLSPVDGIVLGMTTLPTVKPGEPVCHLAVSRPHFHTARRALAQTSGKALHHRVRRTLATSISVSERQEDVVTDAVAEDT